MTVKIRLRQEEEPLSRTEAKAFVRERIRYIRLEMEDVYEHEIGIMAKYAKKLQNRCEHLRELHRMADW